MVTDLDDKGADVIGRMRATRWMTRLGLVILILAVALWVYLLLRPE
jgi:hypothetical protein